MILFTNYAGNKTITFDPSKNGVDALVVQLYTMCTSNPNKETWRIDEVYDAWYPDATTHDRAKTMVILKNNLKWLKSKAAVGYQNNNSIKLVKYRLSSLIDGF
ncbi:hypothetical protein [Candidatus Nitrosocosmicus arcticus]|uniref:Uncharacterized protein n=1 Tax=Candidatus Nitrosocosmicus arcticus TaxID=2035267 RepID=A0A557SU69_9ARCH|nr:hypothetical protein [Candidatus Nitrosocosmicus arcticus]TVP40152.1 hypothetical protein NARC_90058 [Candidatus Nitrosocosmicus arcticus]